MLRQAAACEEPAVQIFRSAGDSRWLSLRPRPAGPSAHGPGTAGGGASAAGRGDGWCGAVSRPLTGNLSTPTCAITWAVPRSPKATPMRPKRTLKPVCVNSTPPATTWLTPSCSGASGCWPHGGASTPRRGPGSLTACRCCAGARTSGTWPCSCSTAGLEETEAESPAARALLTEALQAWQRLGGNAGMALALAGLGEVAAGHGASRRAGQLLGAGRALLPATDPLLRVIVPYDLSTRLAAARAGGDPAAFDRGLAEGQAWDIDRAVVSQQDWQRSGCTRAPLDARRSSELSGGGGSRPGAQSTSTTAHRPHVIRHLRLAGSLLRLVTGLPLLKRPHVAVGVTEI